MIFMMRHRFIRLLKRMARNQRGAIAVIFVICLGLLAGAVAISVEVGSYMNMATQLQHAADASALAGASQLDNKAGAIARAQMAATGALVNNLQIFANDGNPNGINIVVTPSDIVFYNSLDPRVIVNIADADADELAKFIEVNVAPRTVNYAFATLVGVNNASAGARAIAGLGQAICSVPPMMMCNPTETSGNPFVPDDFEGQGIILKSAGKNSAWAPGNFGLLALNNHNLSTNDLRDAMGRINPLAVCFSTDGELGSKPGESAAVAQGFNTRFDIYEGATSGLDNDDQYAPAANAVKGMIKAGSACSYNPNGGNGWTKPANTYDGPEDLDSADAMGFPRDNCAYHPLSSGDGDCTITSSTRIGTGNWDVGSFTDVNHGGVNWTTEIGTSMPTRYQVYQWEIGNAIVNNGATGGENANPQCNTQTPAAGPDRRVISIAVVNCIASGVTGQTPNLDVAKWIELFITEPMGADGGNNFLYGEIIGEAIAGQTKEDVIKFVPQLYE